MSEKNNRRKKIASPIIGLLLMLAIGCSGFMLLRSVSNLLFEPTPFPTATPIPTPTISPTQTPIPPTATPNVPTATPDPFGWQPVRPGLETRNMPIADINDGRILEQLTVIRLDPNQFNFDVGYSPGQPLPLDQWQRQSGALIAINAGYFTADHFATGLTIAQGQVLGSSYGPFAGMVTIGGNGPSSAIDVRWLSQTPYWGEPLWGGFQSFPMLIHSNGTAAFPASSDNGDRSRRTVIGRDGAGNILLIVAGRGWFTLSELSAWLAQSDLDLQIAINLDGGTSSGMILDHPNQQQRILPFIPLPTVLLVYE